MSAALTWAGADRLLPPMRRLSRAAATCAFLSISVFVAAPTAAAQWRPDGAITGDVLVRQGTALGSGKPDLGGGLVVDLWQPYGVVGVGFCFGLQALGGGAAVTRVFTPIAASMVVGSRPRPVGAELRLRAGAWTGATNAGFAAGPLLTAGAYMVIEVDPTVRVAIGMEGWFAFGHGNTYVFAPSLSLAWALERE